MMFLNIWTCSIICLLAAATIVGGVVLLLLLLRVYIYLSTGICKSKVSMKGKTVLITGCTSGIGRETARNLIKRGARLIMACRNIEAATKLKDELIKESGSQEIVVHKLDLSSLKSVRDFAKQVKTEESRLDVLIHNAGTAETFTKKISVDGIEMTMATNHYGPFLLTHLLIDLLKRSAPSRIIVVASSLYRLSNLNLDNINPTTTFPAYLYYVSKYANIMFTLELARRLEGTGVTANCLHPGMIDSGIWRNVPVPLSWGLQIIVKSFFKTPEQGAQTSIQLAISEHLKNTTGKYFSDCQESSLSAGVSDAAKCKKFWELSENIIKLQSTDPKI